MNWILKVTVGLLLLATLFIAIGVMFIRANAYQANTTNINTHPKTNVIPKIEIIKEIETKTSMPVLTPAEKKP